MNINEIQYYLNKINNSILLNEEKKIEIENKLNEIKENQININHN